MATKRVSKIIEIFKNSKEELKSWDYDLIKRLILVETPHKLILNPATDVLFTLNVEDSFCNLLGTMHGGAIATLIDLTTTLAISGIDKTYRTNVSVQLSTNYQNPIKKNSNILIFNRVSKIGKTLAYSTGEIYDQENKLLSNSVHIKAMLEKTWL